MFIQAILVFLLLFIFIIVNWNLWIKKRVYDLLDIVEVKAEDELDKEIQTLMEKRAELNAMKNIVNTEKELSKLDKKIKELKEKREELDI